MQWFLALASVSDILDIDSVKWYLCSCFHAVFICSKISCSCFFGLFSIKWFLCSCFHGVFIWSLDSIKWYLCSCLWRVHLFQDTLSCFYGSVHLFQDILILSLSSDTFALACVECSVCSSVIPCLDTFLWSLYQVIPLLQDILMLILSSDSLLLCWFLGFKIPWSWFCGVILALVSGGFLVPRYLDCLSIKVLLVLDVDSLGPRYPLPLLVQCSFAPRYLGLDSVMLISGGFICSKIPWSCLYQVISCSCLLVWSVHLFQDSLLLLFDNFVEQMHNKSRILRCERNSLLGSH